ncbi:MAG TPA: nitroreductase family protein [Gaiellaceae bacterium]
MTLEYHRATNVVAGGTDEDEVRTVETLPVPFKDYPADAERLPLETSVAGPLLEAGAGIVRSREAPSIGRTIYFRGYSSAGALYPVEAYVASAEGVFSFDALGHELVRLGRDVRGPLAQAAATPVREAFVILTGIHARTGWKYMERGYRHIWWDAGTMLANLLALAAADDLAPRLHTAFVDREVNGLLDVDGRHEYALALLGLGPEVESPPNSASNTLLLSEAGLEYPLAEGAHAASALHDADAVRASRVDQPGGEPKLARDVLVRAIRRRGSVRDFSPEPLPRDEVAEVLAWSEAPIPADVPPVVRQWVTVNAVEGLEPGIYDAQLKLMRSVPEDELRERSGFAAMEQDHPRLAAFDVWQMADLDDVGARLGDRGYRWAQLEAGIRAGRLQIGAFMRGWGAAASTFYDEEVSKLLDTDEAPLLMVAIGNRG